MNVEGLYRNIINSLEDGIYFVNNERRITTWNAAAERITGFSADEIVGRHCQDNILSHIDMEGRPLCVLGCPLFATMGDGETRQEEVLLRHKLGHRVAVLVKALPIYEDGAVVGAVEIFTPMASVIGSSQLVDTLTSKAMTDSLTNLPNRAFLESNLAYRMEEYKRFGKLYCVMMMDIDDFRNFNNFYGHHVGDKVLKSIAESISGNTRDSDSIGRWGGEEFLGIFTIGNEGEAYTLGEKIRLIVMRSEILDGEERLNVTASIGMAVGNPEDCMESVIKRADQMMYLSKRRGKNYVSVDYMDKYLLDMGK